MATDKFLDILTQFYYTPHILQPTRTRLSDICKHNILYNKQFGFRSSYSTIYAVLSILDNIHKAIENKFFSCGIFLDLSKDFDYVDHNILLHKLNHYGIRGLSLDWFTSYLSDRRQFVSLGCIDSDVHTISYGVPQGSVLGPLLFLLLINDFQNSSKKLDFHLFADDANLFYVNKSLIDLECQVNQELVNVQN